MEEKEKKPWRPPEAAHLPDPIAFAMHGFERFGLQLHNGLRFTV